MLKKTTHTVTLFSETEQLFYSIAFVSWSFTCIGDLWAHPQLLIHAIKTTNWLKRSVVKLLMLFNNLEEREIQ